MYMRRQITLPDPVFCSFESVPRSEIAEPSGNSFLNVLRNWLAVFHDG